MGFNGYQWESIGVSRVFVPGCWKEVLRVLTKNFKGVSRKFKGCFKEVSTVFQGSFWEISRVFQESFKGVSKNLSKSHECFKTVSRKFKAYQKSFKIALLLVLLSSQLPEQKEGLLS